MHTIIHEILVISCLHFHYFLVRSLFKDVTFTFDIDYCCLPSNHRAIQKSNCYHEEGHNASCTYGDNLYMLIFGIFQVVISQIPNFHKLEWLSFTAAAMSFTYSSIGTALGFAKVIGITFPAFLSTFQKLSTFFVL